LEHLDCFSLALHWSDDQHVSLRLASAKIPGKEAI
jgi:hypothetical protein